MHKSIENLTNKEQLEIKKCFETFKYLVDHVSHDIKPALKWFNHDRDLALRELQLIVLNNLYLYTTIYCEQPLNRHVGTDPGLLGLYGAFERVRGVTGFEKLLGELPRMNKLYNKWSDK